MRITVFCVVLALYVIACGTTPKPIDVSNRVAPPVEIAITIDPGMRERLAIGLPVDVELRTHDKRVGRCTLSFDLWEEHYRVAFSKTHVEHARDIDAAARLCVDREAVQHVAKGRQTAIIDVREAPYERPLYQPPAYDEF